MCPTETGSIFQTKFWILSAFFLSEKYNIVPSLLEESQQVSVCNTPNKPIILAKRNDLFWKNFQIIVGAYALPSRGQIFLSDLSRHHYSSFPLWEEKRSVIKIELIMLLLNHPNLPFIIQPSVLASSAFFRLKIYWAGKDLTFST